MYQEPPTLEGHARRLGASPMPLAYGEVAELRRYVKRRAQWRRLVLDVAVLALAGWGLFVLFAFASAALGRG